MQTLTLLQNLMQKLDAWQGSLPVSVASQWLRELPLDLNDVQGFVRFEPGLYARHTVKCTENYELLVVCWDSGQRSTVHDHEGSICAFRVLSGVATELHFEESAIGELFVRETARLEGGSVQSCDGEGVHQILNLEKAPLVSVHIYSPPLRRANHFGLQATTFGAYPELMRRVIDRAQAASTSPPA